MPITRGEPPTSLSSEERASELLRGLYGRSDRDVILSARSTLVGPHSTDHDKAIAVALLGTQPSVDAVDLLREHLSVLRGQALLRALRAAGRIGDASFLPLIDTHIDAHRAAPLTEAALAQERGFARTLIAFRLRLAEGDLVLPQRPPPVSGTGSPYGFTITSNPAKYASSWLLGSVCDPSTRHILTCGRVQRYLFFTTDFIKAVTHEVPLQRKLVIASLATVSRFDDRFSPGFVVIGQPNRADGSIDIAILRRTGVIAFWGSAAQARDGSMSVSVRSASLPGSYPVDLRLRYIEGVLAAESALSLGKPIKRQVPLRQR